jgi:Zn-dependent protease
LSGSPFFFGWGRPVNTQPRYYTRKITMRAGMALVSFAGPLSNLLLSVMTLGLVWGLGAAGALTVSSPLYQPLYLFFVLNIILFLFNLIPVHPLDGGKVLSWLMGPKYGHVDEFLERNGVWILVALIFILPALNPNLDVLGAVFLPILEFGGALFRAVLG